MDFSWPNRTQYLEQNIMVPWRHGINPGDKWTGDRYLNQLVPMLDGFTGVGQHGCPVLSARTFSVAAHAAHPNHLIMADTERDRRYTETWSALRRGTKMDITMAKSHIWWEMERHQERREKGASAREQTKFVLWLNDGCENPSQRTERTLP